MSKQSIVGKQFESNHCGAFEVIAKAGRDKGRTQLYMIRFLKTGYEAKARKAEILRGGVKDPYHPSVCGVGFLGESSGSEGGKEKSSYSRWKNMLCRCYNADYPRYKNYGGRGITVCKRWHCFEHYEEDAQHLEGYDDPNRDTIDRINNDAIYEPSNCRWATRKTQNNNQRDRKDQKTFVAIPPGPGDGFYFGNNQRQFAREHGLIQSNISGCLKGRYQTHKGWRFLYLDV